MPNLNTIPNWVTLSRLLSIPIIFMVLSNNDSTMTRQIATIAFLIAALTDWLDGYLARTLNQVSEFGKFLDPLVDKLLVIAALLILLELEQIPAWAVFVIIAREILITAWRGAPDASTPTIIGANIWGKVKTVSQILAIAALLLEIPYALALFWLAVILTIVSGLIYVLPLSTQDVSSG
ncbi:CDP-diacylglycerol--glycerol-3-phosphate 3-phosphatidyltransferase [Synechococcus sp. PCC 7502]|uniref:CDP-diacylglycerol--glycerol-3-phosphate 3-phosphatidyltransferase n=1 Tax=Synechococcus sp. PCC 7502 TaxID=1173263 RepID=UPI00029FDA7F|nr:CDP-diacylglycerol--glycerol-3-phosphate 3-phosphatidyltransferase [Synechococcus sp. PCC 7502]AFY74316.1 CDP-diacylglycerol--glycerol-3-phosphate 3-phosphatidyltransferase [Synechococcus sp. PCC 7502]